MRLSELSAPALLLAAMGVLVCPTPAGACGAFFPRVTKNVPTLSAEQTLIVHDGVKGVEHFIREVAFRDGGEPFGFVVPVPARPEVVSVKHRPFAGLNRDFGMNVEPPGGSDGIGRGHGNGRSGEEGGVTVLEVKQVGSFKAFVLAANDSAGLRTWLDENQFTTTKDSERWLEGYVRQRFFFVALRHEPPAVGGKKPKHQRVIAETIRLTFASPVPYYPYREPDHDTPGERQDRLLALWLVTNGGVHTPVALREAHGARELVRPFRDGAFLYSPTVEAVGASIGNELKPLLPAPEPGRSTLTLQTFEDQKTSRRGFGDVLFVPTTATQAPPELKRLQSILDPSLGSAP